MVLIVSELSDNLQHYCADNSVTIADCSRSLSGKGFSHILLFDKNENSFPVGFHIWKDIYRATLSSGDIYPISNDPELKDRWSIIPYYFSFIYSGGESYYRPMCPIYDIPQLLYTEEELEGLIRYVVSVRDDDESPIKFPEEAWDLISPYFKI